MVFDVFFFFFSSRRRHTRSLRDWSSDVCSSDLVYVTGIGRGDGRQAVELGVMELLTRHVDRVGLFRPLVRSEEHTSELQSRRDLVCRLLLEKKKNAVITSKGTHADSTLRRGSRS